MSDLHARLPPRQVLAARGKWPLVGERSPRGSDQPWTVRVSGVCRRPAAFGLATLREMGIIERTIDIHCVTRWSRLGVRFSGIPLRHLLERCEPAADARFVRFVARSERDHDTSLPLTDALALDALVAFEHEGAPLSVEHGGPVRLVVPGRYFYKSLKWLECIELRADDRLGYWEGSAGYHNHADPWAEERYVLPDADRAAVLKHVQARDLVGADFLGVRMDDMRLPGLRAAGAILRDAWFRRATLTEADFARANLSNALFEGTDLRRAVLRRADVEGACFRGADLRGADLRGASLFGATFCAEAGDDAEPWPDARLDDTTRIDAASLTDLSDAQRAFLAPLASASGAAGE